MKTTVIKQPLLALCVALTCAWAGQASAMTKDEYKAANDRISAEYKTDKDACASYSAHAKEVCLEQAKGKERVASAALDYNYTGKPYQMLINGYTGKVAGYYPKSWVKITLLVLAILIVIGIIIFLANNR